MIRIVVNPLINPSGHSIISNKVCIQSVRWRRKPRWLGTAKSKIFRVPERKVQDPDEKLELLRLHNNYRTQMRSLRAFLREETERLKLTTTSDHLIVTPEEEAAEFKRRQEINIIWNEKCEKIRNERLKEEENQRNELIMKRLEDKEIRDEERLQRAEEIVRLEKERSKTFITKENLDQAIEHALANPVDYNFAIDMQKNIYKGRETPTNVKKDEKLATVAVQS